MTSPRAFLKSTPARCLTAAIATAAFCHAPVALAQDEVIAPGPGLNGLPDDGATHWGLGLGVGVIRKPYTDDESKTRALPLVFFDNQYVRVLGLGADIKLPTAATGAGPVSFALRLRYAPRPYDQSDAPILNGMSDRKAGLLAGGATALRTGVGLFTAEALGDISGHSKGAQVKLGYAAPLRFGAFSIAPHVDALWLDSKTVDYSYGVRASEARTGRPQYSGTSTVNTELGVRTGYTLTPRQMLTLDVGTTLFGSGIKASPLVDRSSQTSVRAGYIYRF